MKRDMKLLGILCILAAFPACNGEKVIRQAGADREAPGASNTPAPPLYSPTPTPNPDVPTKISFFLTNDIHGYLVPNVTYLSSMVKQIRALPEYQNNLAGLFVLDSGDQFQGTLLSNFDEGKTVFDALNVVQYDAIIPGNHDYDFGPINWLYDQCNSTSGHCDGGPRGVITARSTQAHFPMLSANTYNKASLKTKGSSLPVAVDDTCKPTSASLMDPIDFASGTHPEYLKPYTIVEKAGVRVALIGIDFHGTTATTTASNVSDLCFRDEVDAYLDVRKALEGQADVFVLMMHNGDVPYANSTDGTTITQKINAAYPNGVSLVAAGHTHQIYNVNVDGVVQLQDGCNAASFGRVDLYVDPKTKQVLPNMTQSWAGMPIDPNKCDVSNPKKAFACQQFTYPIPADPQIDQIVSNAQAAIAPIADEPLATVQGTISVNRIGESALGDILTDALRHATGTQVSFMNTGGIRTTMKPGTLTYSGLFAISPFQNLAVVFNKMPWPNLKAVLQHAINTCGSYGTLVESGLKVRYAGVGCVASTQMYTSATLQHVEFLDGTVLLDTATGTEADSTTTVSVTTLDFLANGGDAYPFNFAPVDQTFGIARDMIQKGFEASHPTLTATTDGRFVNTAPFQDGTPTPTPVPTPSPTPSVSLSL